MEMRYEIIGPLAVSVLMAAPGAHAGVDVGGLDALLKRANFWEERGNDELALVALDKALRLAPDDQNILGRLAIVQLRTLRRTLAAATVARLQALNPQHPALATTRLCRSSWATMPSAGAPRARWPVPAASTKRCSS